MSCTGFDRSEQQCVTLRGGDITLHASDEFGVARNRQVDLLSPLRTPILGDFGLSLTPGQNGLVERVIQTLKETCAHRHGFETLQHASRAIGDWISHRRPHHALEMITRTATFRLRG